MAYIGTYKIVNDHHTLVTKIDDESTFYYTFDPAVSDMKDIKIGDEIEYKQFAGIRVQRIIKDSIK